MKEREGRMEQPKNDETQIDLKWPQGPVDLTDHNFNEFVKGYPLLVVDFWAPWCMPCKMVGPVIEELAKDYRGKVIFGKMNVDRERQIAGKYGIMSIPTILIFKNGKMADQQVGAMPRGILESIIKKHI